MTSDTIFFKYLLIVDADSKIPKLYGMEKITTEEDTEKSDGPVASNHGNLQNTLPLALGYRALWGTAAVNGTGGLILGERGRERRRER